MTLPTNTAMPSVGTQFLTGISDGGHERGMCVKRTVSENGFEVCDTKGERVDGIAWTSAADGDAFTYVPLVPGTTLGECLAGAALGTLGTDLVTSAAGKLIATDGAGQFVVGQNRSTTGGADEWVGVSLEDGLRATA